MKNDIKLIQILSQHWETENGEKRFSIYGLGNDGALYKKIGNSNRGWIRQNMTIEFDDGAENVLP